MDPSSSSSSSSSVAAAIMHDLLLKCTAERPASSPTTTNSTTTTTTTAAAPRKRKSIQSLVDMLKARMSEDGDTPKDDMLKSAGDGERYAIEWSLWTCTAVTRYLLEPTSDDRLSQLKLLLHYILSLVSDLPCTSIPRLVIEQAIGRVVASSYEDLDARNEDSIRVLLYAYTSAFKALIYLELHDIPFDVDFVVDTVRWKNAYGEIAGICHLYRFNYCGVTDNEIYGLCHENCKFISDDVTHMLTSNLKAIAKHTTSSEWDDGARTRTDKLYGAKLQWNPVMSRVRQLVDADTFKRLDARVPNAMYNEENEFITLLLAFVHGVDRVFGTVRNDDEMNDLRLMLATFGCCDHDGDTLSHRSINWLRSSYGLYRCPPHDALNPVGFNSCSLLCPVGNNWEPNSAAAHPNEEDAATTMSGHEETTATATAVTVTVVEDMATGTTTATAPKARPDSNGEAAATTTTPMKANTQHDSTTTNCDDVAHRTTRTCEDKDDQSQHTTITPTSSTSTTRDSDVSSESDGIGGSSSGKNALQQVDAYTLRHVNSEGDAEYYGFIMDVTKYRLPAGSVTIQSKFDDLLVYYANAHTSMTQSDIGRLHDITMSIREVLMAEFSLKTPFPSPKGIEAIAFVLSRPWRQWRGLEIANAAVVIAAMKQLQNLVEHQHKSAARLDDFGCRRVDEWRLQDSPWTGLKLDLEVIAMSRAIVKSPTSYVLMAYIAHIVTASPFHWEHHTPFTPFCIGAHHIVPLFSDEQVAYFVRAERRELTRRLISTQPISYTTSSCTFNNPSSSSSSSTSTVALRRRRKRAAVLHALYERQGCLVIRTRPPYLLYITLTVALVVCVMSPFFTTAPAWDVAAQIVRNIGTGFVPLLLACCPAILRGLSIPDALRRAGDYTCRSLDEASRITGLSPEEIGLLVRQKGIASAVFRQDVPSILCRNGNGLVASGSVAMKASVLYDLGVLFVADAPDENEDHDDIDERAKVTTRRKVIRGMVDIAGFARIVPLAKKDDDEDDDEEEGATTAAGSGGCEEEGGEWDVRCVAVPDRMKAGVWRVVPRKDIEHIVFV